MKALIVCTGIGVFPSRGTKTGLWFGELVHYYDVLSKKRVEMDIVSPSGGEVPVDPRSLDSRDETIRRYQHDPLFMSKISNVPPVASVDASLYGIVYLAGGHGAMWDFPENERLQEVIAEVYQNYGTITAVGHGVGGMLNVRLSDGSWFVKDRYITGFSNMEETLSSFVSEVPYYLEDKLTEKGANFTRTMIPFTEHIEMDERIITGQNPNSARKVAQKLVEELWEK